MMMRKSNSKDEASVESKQAPFNEREDDLNADYDISIHVGKNKSWIQIWAAAHPQSHNPSL
jgi:hypothetical protein